MECKSNISLPTPRWLWVWRWRKSCPIELWGHLRGRGGIRICTGVRQHSVVAFVWQSCCSRVELANRMIYLNYPHRAMRQVYELCERMVHAISAIKIENDVTALKFAYVCIASAPSEAMWKLVKRRDLWCGTTANWFFSFFAVARLVDQIVWFEVNSKLFQSLWNLAEIHFWLKPF